jgi:hypothetical protein
MPGVLQTVSFSSVKGSPAKTVELLQNLLKNDKPVHRNVVIFLGEEHNNAIDTQVTRSVLRCPPLVSRGRTRVIFEHGLGNRYGTLSTSIDSVRDEPSDGKHMWQRNIRFANMITDAFDDGDMDIVYLVCGSDHVQGVFNELDARAGVPFTMVAKRSCTD